LISIIMPVYNAEQYIITSVESVIHQSHRDWELLIINDGSTDDTEKIIIGFKDSRIRYYSQKNKGVSYARNVGLKNMKGHFFCFLDADDYFPTRSLEYRILKLNKNPDIDYLDGRVDIYDQNLVRKIDYWLPTYQGNPLIPLLNISNTCFFSPTWMIRRKPNKTYRFHEGLSHGEDLLFLIELALEGGRYDFIEETIMHYRRGHCSAMNDLKGVEYGYQYIFNSIKNLYGVTPIQVRNFKRIARNIIFKSYLGNYQLKNAIISLIKKW